MHIPGRKLMLSSVDWPWVRKGRRESQPSHLLSVSRDTKGNPELLLFLDFSWERINKLLVTIVKGEVMLYLLNFRILLENLWNELYPPKSICWNSNPTSCNISPCVLVREAQETPRNNIGSQSPSITRWWDITFWLHILLNIQWILTTREIKLEVAG